MGSDGNTNKTYAPMQITSCDGRIYTITTNSVQMFDGTLIDPTKFSWNSNTLQYSVMLDKTTDSAIYVGSIDFKITASLNDLTITTYVRLIVQPDTYNSYGDVYNPNH